MFKITIVVTDSNAADSIAHILASSGFVSSVVTEDVKRTPFNNQMIGIVADRFDLSVCYISQWLSDNNVSSVEDAIQKTSINGMADFLREAFLDVE